MIGGCLLSAGYAFEADIYTKTRIKDAQTGQLEYKWQLWKTVSCMVTPFVSTSFKAQGTTESFGEMYDKQSYLNLVCKENIGRSVQITNIRSKSTGEVIYCEIELRGAPPTWYNSMGSSPVLDPFGEVIEWSTLIERAEEQGEAIV